MKDKLNKLNLLVVLTATVALPAMPQRNSDDHAKQHSAAAAANSVEMTAGEVRKVDKDAKKITIKHGEIKNFDMPPMTMVFQVKDSAMLRKVKVGDRVRFRVEESATGAYTITDIQLAK